MRARASAFIGLAIAVLATGACKKDGVAQGPDLADDIDAIESALNDRDRELNAQGVVVAYRSTPRTLAEPAAPEVEAPTTPQGPLPDAGSDPPAPPEPTAPDFEADASDMVSRAPAEDASPPMSARDDEREESQRSSRRAKRAKSSPPTRCERMCSLAQSTCDLRDRICRMAERHFGDIRYATSCQRAEDQCDAVRSECESCAA